jgi:peptidoglycan/LPS O-acetylase OafA/YrhL
LVGNRFLRAIMREWTGPVTGLQAVGLFAAALGVSLVGSMAVFFCVERPSHELSRRIASRLRLRSKQLPEARVQPQT